MPETRGIAGSPGDVGQSAADLADAILEVIERGGRHAWVEVVELCAKARREGSSAVGKSVGAPMRRPRRSGP